MLSKFLLVGDLLIPEMHLTQPRQPTYGAGGPFTKNEERIQKFKETVDSGYIYQKQNYIKLAFKMKWVF